MGNVVCTIFVLTNLSYMWPQDCDEGCGGTGDFFGCKTENNNNNDKEKSIMEGIKCFSRGSNRKKTVQWAAIVAQCQPS